MGYVRTLRRLRMSWSFLAYVLRKRQDSEAEWIFRGQREVRWDLVPKIDRPLYRQYRGLRGWRRRKHEDRLLTDFQKGTNKLLR